MVDRAGVEAVLKPIKVGPEMAALRRFLPEVVTWEGTIHEGGMDRAPRRCAGSAGGTSKLIQDGRWIAGDYEQDQFLAGGTFVLTWQLHWVAGWAPSMASSGRRWPTTRATTPNRASLTRCC